PAPDFARDVQPILAKHCVSCHGPDKQRGSLRLDSATSVRAGGSSGEVVVPGKSGASLLVKAVAGAEGVKAMPPKGPRLSPAEQAALPAWIDPGAIVPRGDVLARGAPRSLPWSFQPSRRPNSPNSKDAA